MDTRIAKTTKMDKSWGEPNFCVSVFWLFFTDAYTKIHMDFTSSSSNGEGI